MVLVLCIGDLHIPDRVIDIPPKFKALLVPGKIHKILCTGNLSTEATYDYLRSICSDITRVQGEFDQHQSPPDTIVVSIGEFKIGLCHGHQIVPWGDKAAISALQRKLDVDILVTGHTHQFQAYKSADGGGFVINPGSATGAPSLLPTRNEEGSTAATAAPSFVLMDVNGARATVYMYQLVSGEVKVEKMVYEKT